MRRKENSPTARALKAEIVGRKVLSGLELGRQKRILQAREEGAKTLAIVITLYNEFVSDGFSRRGLPGLIARRLGGKPSEGHVRKILSRALSNRRDSHGYNAATKKGGAAHAC